MIVEAIRLLITLVLTAIGFELGPGLVGASVETAESARVFGAVLGAGVGYVMGGVLGRRLRRDIEAAPNQIGLQLSGAELFTGAFGLVVGLAVGIVLAAPIVVVIRETFAWPLAGLVVFVIGAIGARVFSARSDDLMGALGLGNRRPLVRRGMDEHERTHVIDSSAAIDGRILELVRASLIDGRIWIPMVVLDELQGLADSANKSTRRKGRRGLDVLQALEDEPAVTVAVLDDTVPEVVDVDAKLLTLCERANGRLITTDHNLSRPAELRGISVVNPNVIAEAVKTTVAVGQRLTVPISRKGSEPGQGVGYLDDGTMVVIEGAAGHMGEDLDVEVTSSTRTSIGRMLFAKLAA